MEPAAIEARAGGVLLRVKVQPKASRNAVLEAGASCYRLALTAPPVEGAANDALVRFLARLLGVPRRRIALAGGRRARVKSLEIEGVDADTVRAAFERALHG